MGTSSSLAPRSLKRSATLYLPKPTGTALLVLHQCRTRQLTSRSIAPLHLVVLQSLILDDGFPRPLLRTNAAAIMCVMEPTKGLGEVMDKAEFDANAVKTKLRSVGANTLPSMSLNLTLAGWLPRPE